MVLLRQVKQRRIQGRISGQSYHYATAEATPGRVSGSGLTPEKKHQVHQTPFLASTTEINVSYILTLEVQSYPIYVVVVLLSDKCQFFSTCIVFKLHESKYTICVPSVSELNFILTLNT